jgi:hypothetical protein
MLDLTPSDATLDSYSQRFLDESLPGGLSRKDFSAFDASAYEPPLLVAGRDAWRRRTLDEYRSQLAFTQFLSEITQLGFAWDALSMGVRVVRDEARHTELCRRMVVALGGEAIMDGEPNRVCADERQPLRSRICQTVVTSLCIGETVSVRMLAAARDQAVDPLARRALTTLVADESIHSRFGWALLQALNPLLTRAERESARELIPVCLATVEQLMTTPAPTPEHPFGAVSPALRAEVFHDSLERDVLGGFRELGLS